MNFRIWLENMSREHMKKIVLDAVGISSDDKSDAINDVLSSLLRHHPDLEHELSNYKELRSYKSNISGWLHANKNKTLQQLIDFLADLDEPSKEVAPQEPEVGISGLGNQNQEPVSLPPNIGTPMV